MRQINKSEKFLITLLSLVVFSMGNLVAFVHLTAWGRALNLKRTALNQQKLVADAWLGQSALWKAREKWLEATRPLLTPEITPATQVHHLKELSSAHGVRILDQSLMEGAPLPGCHTFAIRLRLSGQLEQMVAWLHALQTPSSFVECSAFVCHAGTDAHEMDWEITLSRYYGEPKK